MGNIFFDICNSSRVRSLSLSLTQLFVQFSKKKAHEDDVSVFSSS